MDVYIGSARINENGQLEGGKPGDQSGNEVCSEPWYKHEKGWVVVRAKSPEVRKKIAQNMRAACANDMIGYSFWNSCYTLYNEVEKYGWDCSKVNTPCDTNCAKLVLICTKYGGVNPENFSTADEVEKLKATGAFDVLMDSKYCSRPDYLLEGDILVTKTKGHTAVVLNNGDKAAFGTPFKTWNCKAVNIRDGGSTDGNIICTIDGGERVDLYDWSDTGWGYVRYLDVFGYIAPQYLKELDKAVCLGGNTWLRDKPGKLKGSKILVIHAGDVVHITGKTERVGLTTWYETIADGRTGWASGLYIKPL